MPEWLNGAVSKTVVLKRHRGFESHSLRHIIVLQHPQLVSFCSTNGLSTIGGKADLINRIEYFLQTGQKLAPIKIKRIDRWDSDNKITKNTLVINYKNDAKTRSFFEKEIGTHFRFNAYLRQFAKNSNKDSNLTYGDLVKGWIKVEEQKQNSSYKSSIGKQFEFNQFQRDFYGKEKGKNQKRINSSMAVGTFSGWSKYIRVLFKNNK